MRKLIVSILAGLATIALGYMAYYYFVRSNYTLSLIMIGSTALMFILFIVFLFMFLNKTNIDKITDLETRIKLWKNISYHVNQAGDEVFNNLPIGLLVYDDSQEINWANEHAKKIFNNTP